MGRKNRHNRGNFRPNQHGQPQQGRQGGFTQPAQKGGGPVVVQSQPAKSASDGDVFASIAALGERIDQLKARWSQTQSRIEQLRTASSQVLREQVLREQGLAEQPQTVDAAGGADDVGVPGEAVAAGEADVPAESVAPAAAASE